MLICQAIAVFLVTYLGIHILLALRMDDKKFTIPYILFDIPHILFEGVFGIWGAIAGVVTIAFVLWNS